MDTPLLDVQVSDLGSASTLAAHRRRDHYRLLARRAVQHAQLARRPVPPGSRAAIRPVRIAREAKVASPGVSTPPAPGLTIPAERICTSDVQIRCFGRFQLSRNGKTVEHWRRRSAERLLKVLLVNGRRVHRDVLLEVLWPDMPIKSSMRGLRVTLHALRRAIAQVAPERNPLDLIRAEGDTYVLNTEGMWIDSEAFDEHYAAGLRFERLRQVDSAMREYMAAEALYRDDFLVEDLYEEWTVLPREELKDKYLLILTRLSQFNLACQDLDGCIRRSHALLAKEPCREDAYQRLMQCYARLGQRASALRWYQICERTLQRELDVAPSDDTRRLLQEISAASA